MNSFRADLHIHTVLSPCADLEMTPGNIIKAAKESHLDIIGITDHNSTRNAQLVKALAEKESIFVLTGAEVTTKEEVHCLAFFEKEEELVRFQHFLDEQIAFIPNTENYFGYQPVIDKDENILEMISNYLPAALKVGITEVQNQVKLNNGIFIAAHVDRPANGIFSQLGFIPDNLKFDALGISRFSSENDVRKHYVIEKKISLLRNSDAHFLHHIGDCFSLFYIQKPDFYEIKMALNQEGNRFVEIDEDHC
jgi:PHP family Zn ribbon phosphoesterase